MKRLLAALITLILCEVGTRALLTSPSRQVFDAEIGYRYIPNSTLFSSQEGGARLRLNSLGFNDAEPKAGKPLILALGDSLVESIQVPQSSNFTSLMEKMSNYDVFNAGMAGTGPFQYVSIYERLVNILRPQIVIIFFGRLDLYDMAARPYQITRDAGKITAVKTSPSQGSRIKGALEPLTHHSALATYLMRRMRPLFDRFVADQGRDANESEILDQSEVISFLLMQVARRQPLIAVYLPEIEYVSFRQAAVNETSRAEAEVFRRAANDANVPFFLASDIFVEEFKRTGTVSHGFANRQIGIGHLNEDGHRILAAALVRVLEEQHLIDAKDAIQ